MRRPPSALVFVSCLLALALLACGCQKAVHGPEAGTLAYTNRNVLLRVSPSPKGRTTASLGPNVEVSVMRLSDGYAKISADNGRMEGWVESYALGGAPVTQSAPPAVKKPQRAAPAAAPAPVPARPDVPQPAPAKTFQPEPQASAPPQAQPSPAAVTPAAPLAPAHVPAATPTTTTLSNGAPADTPLTPTPAP